MENKNEKVNCLVCGGKNCSFLFTKNDCDLYRCECGLIFVQPMPQNMHEVYDRAYFNGATAGFGYVDYDNDKVAMIPTFNKYLEVIENFIPNRGRLLDVGSATGFFMKLAHKRGWEVSGVEISEWAASKGRSEGLNILTGSLEQVNFLSNHFDVVCLFDVLEHMPNPSVQLKIVYEILKPGGLVVMSTPDTSSLVAKVLGKNWHLYVPPEHVVYFNPDNASTLLNKNNFKPILLKKIGKKFSLNYIVQILANGHKNFLFKGMASFITKSVLGSVSVPINFRDNFFMVARKRLNEQK